MEIKVVLTDRGKVSQSRLTNIRFHYMYVVLFSSVSKTKSESL